MYANRKRNSAVATLLVLICFLPCLAFPADPASSKDQKLADDLAAIRARIEAQQQTIAQRTKELWLEQQKQERQDPEAVQIRERIVELERELVGLRRQLDARLSLVEGIHEINREREQMFKDLSDLKETERLILNEMATAQYQPEE